MANQLCNGFLIAVTYDDDDDYLGRLLDNLKAALQGDYKAIIDLTRALDGGAKNKVIVDIIIDQCTLNHPH